MVWQKGYKLQGGRYVIEKVLGEGGFGITYQAQHTLLKQWVVIKTPNESLKNDSEYPNYVKRFIQEGRKLAQLSQQPHPNIVRVTELFEDSKTYCLVMDFVPGESLFNLVQKQGALPELKAVEYIKQIGEALIFVHHQGLVHRDAHPGNIMVQKNGKAVLIDFGIAGEIMPQDGYFTSHHPANIAFAPYEQMGGNRQVTIDVYTLAASLYYAVTGKHPESSLDRKLYNKPLIPPNKYVVGISNELNRAILKAMNLEAENRPQSMREWLKLLSTVKGVNSGDKVFHVTNKIEEKTVKTDKTYPVIVSPNNPIKARGKSKNIPWFWLGLISLYYLIIYLFLAYINNAHDMPYTDVPADVAFALMMAFWALICAVVFSAEDNSDLSSLNLWIILFQPGRIFVYYFCFIYFPVKQKLKQSFNKWHQFLIFVTTPWLGIFLGWAIYQIFPIFANR